MVVNRPLINDVDSGWSLLSAPLLRLAARYRLALRTLSAVARSGVLAPVTATAGLA